MILIVLATAVLGISPIQDIFTSEFGFDGWNVRQRHCAGGVHLRGGQRRSAHHCGNRCHTTYNYSCCRTPWQSCCPWPWVHRYWAIRATPDAIFCSRTNIAILTAIRSFVFHARPHPEAITCRIASPELPPLTEETVLHTPGGVTCSIF